MALQILISPKRRGCPIGARGTEAERFWKKVEARNVTDCWIWKSTRYQIGYGQFRLAGGRRIKAYQWLYKASAGCELHHKCKNLICVNPFHIIELTKREHRLLGPGFGGVNSRKTHCPRGHPYDSANTYIKPCDGGRQCRICNREQLVRWRAKRKAAK